MKPADEVQIVARDLLVALADAGIDAVLGGAMAYGFWAIPRATLNIDVTVFVDPERIAIVFPVLEALGARFDRSRALDLARRRGIFDVELRSFRVDVYVPDIPLYAAARERRLLAEDQERIRRLAPKLPGAYPDPRSPAPGVVRFVQEFLARDRVERTRGSPQPLAPGNR